MLSKDGGSHTHLVLQAQQGTIPARLSIRGLALLRQLVPTIEWMEHWTASDALPTKVALRHAWNAFVQGFAGGIAVWVRERLFFSLQLSTLISAVNGSEAAKLSRAMMEVRVCCRADNYQRGLHYKALRNEAEGGSVRESQQRLAINLSSTSHTKATELLVHGYVALPITSQSVSSGYQETMHEWELSPRPRYTLGMLLQYCGIERAERMHYSREVALFPFRDYTYPDARFRPEEPIQLGHSSHIYARSIRTVRSKPD
ncbi:hypothetical protein F5146DRAFT_995451 [Armillaria mellea]|nr:hypothetical protein F5146DRAFT_995451 [Armillaria mellea]